MISFVLRGEPASKANSRQLVIFGKGDAARPSSIKSEKARNYERAATYSIPDYARVMLEGPVGIRIKIYYKSERPDLDESVILDVLQATYTKKANGERLVLRKGVYGNDRQVREKHIYHAIDKTNPRAEIMVWSLAEQFKLPGLEHIDCQAPAPVTTARLPPEPIRVSKREFIKTALGDPF